MSGKYRKNNFINEFIGSFELTVPVEGRRLQAHVRPQGEDIYTVILNNAFLAHLVKKEGVWVDYSGNTTELFTVVGKLIEEHLSS